MAGKWLRCVSKLRLKLRGSFRHSDPGRPQRENRESRSLPMPAGNSPPSRALIEFLGIGGTRLSKVASKGSKDRKPSVTRKAKRKCPVMRRKVREDR